MTQATKPHRVLILGGGRGGTAFIELFKDETMLQIVGIADVVADAPAFPLAESQGIPTFDNVEEALRACAPCTAFNLTHDETVSDIASEILGSSNVVGDLAAQLMWQMVTNLKNAHRTSQERFSYLRMVIDNALDGIVLADEKGVIQSFNAAAEKMFGYLREDTIGQNISMLMPEPDRSQHDGYMKRYRETGEARILGVEREMMAQRSNGEVFPISISANSVHINNQDHAIALIRDISERKQIDEQLRESRERFLTLFDLATDAMLILDMEGNITDVNRLAYEQLGHTKEEMLSMHIAQIVPPEFTENLHEGFAAIMKEGYAVFESAHQRKEGPPIPVEVNARTITLNGKQMIFSAVRDITERKQNEEKIRQLAHFDSVTQLPNRSLYFDRLLQSIHQAKRLKQRLAVLFLDLDGFKQVNDSFGHDVGDALLYEVAQRLRHILREMDTVARIGGDEFIFILNDIDCAEHAATVADKIVHSMAEPFAIQENDCRIGASVGIALFPDDGEEPEALVKGADDAMYLAKKSGKNGYRLFRERENSLEEPA